VYSVIRSYAVNASNKLPMLFSFLICAFTVAIVGASSPAIAGQARAAAKHALIDVIRDKNGNPVPAIAGELESRNWSGYVLPKFVTKENYTSAQATWIVPEVIYDGVPSAVGNWVGIGGFCKNANCKSGDKTLIQLGTAQEPLSVTETDYYAWYEMLPKGPVTIPLVVSPGDVITASLSCPGKCKGNASWTLSMTDETTGRSWSTVVKYNSKKLSADWIVEAPGGPGGYAPLADFGITTFSQSMVNAAGADLSTGVAVVMANPNGQSSSVSDPSSTQDGFNACFSFNPDPTLVPCPSP